MRTAPHSQAAPPTFTKLVSPPPQSPSGLVGAAELLGMLGMLGMFVGIFDLRSPLNTGHAQLDLLLPPALTGPTTSATTTNASASAFAVHFLHKKSVRCRRCFCLRLCLQPFLRLHLSFGRLLPDSLDSPTPIVPLHCSVQYTPSHTYVVGRTSA